LINILIPEGVVEIGEYAFDNCTSLVSIYLPDSVKTVATHAFEKCDELVFMRIPSDVEIDKDAFFYVSDRQRLILTDRKMAAKLINKFPDFTENAFFRLTYENITDSSCCNYDFFKANDIIEQEEQSKKIYENFKDSLMKKLGLNGTGEHNGHVYVDLGLPSGTKWATYNIGTSTFEEIGDCFAWGETEVCENVDDLEDDNYMYEDNPSVLPASADVASVKWGEGWRMPTKGEFEELINNCTYKWTEMLGAKGWLFTGTNGNSIFLPAYETKECCDLGPAGFYGTYWSSSLNTAEPNCAWYLYLSENNVDISEYLRVRGLLIRPVCSINE
ncbi:MAG: leucine-rich repeat protein, partial [Bacteroidales bacterium]|nr:leucine-rich repeat protein [Bacteroidales bacterium]